jgi:hypothetical protein
LDESLSISSTETPHRETPSRFRLARLALALVATVNVLLLAAGLRPYFNGLVSPCTGDVCLQGQLSPEAILMLQGLGMSPQFYAGYTLTLIIGTTVTALLVAGVIVWRRPADRGALVTVLCLVTLPPNAVLQALAAASPLWSRPVQVLGWLAAVSLALFFYTFPNGRFVPRLTRWLALAWAVLMLLDNFAPGLLDALPLFTGLTGPLFAGFSVSFGAAQVVRYRRAASSLERQQAKWAAFGLGVAITTYQAYTLAVNLLPGSSRFGSLLPLARTSFDALLILSLTITVGLAILRFRLWDIDLLINRALVYSALTLALTVTYLASVLLLQTILQQISGLGTELATVGSTLLIAALFRPLRTRLQTVIDRRFYRRRYDANQVIAAFGAQLRGEGDPNQSTASLLSVVQDVLEPAHVSLWLHEPAPRRTDR